MGHAGDSGAEGAPVFRWTMQVPFADTDLAGIVHFSNFFRYMENAEHAFYRSLGCTVHPGRGAEGESAVGWPRVQASCDYRKPLRFEDEVTVEIRIRDLRPRSVRYGFAFLLPGEPEPAAVGSLTVVCVALAAEGGIRGAVPIPQQWRARLEAALAAAHSAGEA